MQPFKSNYLIHVMFNSDTLQRTHKGGIIETACKSEFEESSSQQSQFSTNNAQIGFPHKSLEIQGKGFRISFYCSDVEVNFRACQTLPLSVVRGAHFSLNLCENFIENRKN